MIKKWYIEINRECEGPYSIRDLKQDKRITPDTLVWAEGFPNWLRMRDVSELQEVFQDEEAIGDTDEGEDLAEDQVKKTPNEDDVLALPLEPFHLLLWLIIVILVIIYVFSRIN